MPLRHGRNEILKVKPWCFRMETHVDVNSDPGYRGVALLVRAPRRGVGGGRVTGPGGTGTGVSRGGSGTQDGSGPREGRAPVPGNRTAVWPHESAIPGTGDARVAPGDAVRATDPLNGRAHGAGGMGPAYPNAHGTPRRLACRRPKSGSGAAMPREKASPTAAPGHLPRTGREPRLVQPFIR